MMFGKILKQLGLGEQGGNGQRGIRTDDNGRRHVDIKDVIQTEKERVKRIEKLKKDGKYKSPVSRPSSFTVGKFEFEPHAINRSVATEVPFEERLDGSIIGERMVRYKEWGLISERAVPRETGRLMSLEDSLPHRAGPQRVVKDVHGKFHVMKDYPDQGLDFFSSSPSDSLFDRPRPEEPNEPETGISRSSAADTHE